MRQRQIEPRSAGRETVTAEPMVERIVKKEARPKYFFTKMKDEELVDFAKGVIKEKKISGRGKLGKSDPGLYRALNKRSLLNKVGLKRKIREERNWKSMIDEELVEYAKKFMKENGISGRRELQKADVGLYYALNDRGSLNKVGFQRKIREKRKWKLLSDEEIIEYAKTVIKKKGIRGKGELAKADPGLYRALRERSHLGKVGLERIRRNWDLIDDEKIVEYAKGLMKEKEISGRAELEKADASLYFILGKRNLLERVGFERKKHEERDWKSMTDEKLIEYAKKFMRENGIRSRNDLRKADSGLYKALRVRGFICRVFTDIENIKKQSLESELISGLAQAPEAMEKFGDYK